MAAGAALTFGLIQGATSFAGGVSARRAGRAQSNQILALSAAEEAASRRERQRLLADQTVAFAASGGDTSTGSPMDVFADTVAETELQILRDRFTRQSEARAAANAGRQAFTQGVLGGVGSVLGGVAGFANRQIGHQNRLKEIAAARGAN